MEIVTACNIYLHLNELQMQHLFKYTVLVLRRVLRLPQPLLIDAGLGFGFPKLSP